MTIVQRLARRTDITPEGCWLWRGAGNPGGYGVIQGRAAPTDTGKEIRLVHRVSYYLSKGTIPRGMQLDHLCRNRRCINPFHLEAVTQRENILRGEALSAKQARQTHCKNGHEFTESNTDRKGNHRTCRQCTRDRYLRYREAGKTNVTPRGHLGWDQSGKGSRARYRKESQ